MAKTDKPVDAETPAQKKKKKRNKKKLIIAGIIALVVLAIGGFAWYQYDKLKDENARLSDPQASAQAEVERIKTDVANLIDVPQEDPTIASVVDVEKLKNQPFFANAQNGDKVLMYQQSKKAILYRPSTGKIIEVAPINLGNNEQQQSSSNQQ